MTRLPWWHTRESIRSIRKPGKAVIDIDEINPTACRARVIERCEAERLGADHEARRERTIRKVYNEMAKISI